MIEGVIVKGISGFYYVKTCDGIYQCKARGIFKKNEITPMVGDFAEIEILSHGEGIINKLGERKNVFIRPPVANVDCFIIVVSAVKPEPNFSIVDRFLVMAESNSAKVLLCVNKTDIAPPGKVQQIREIYEGVYPLLCVSGKTGDGLGELLARIGTYRCALAGPSGAGKSTLLNGLDASIAAPTGEISKKTSRGKHTTRHTELFETVSGALIFDTPGFTSFETASLDFAELGKYYPEIANCLGHCRFRDCTHLTEPGCRVQEEVIAGKIHPSRYRSYGEQYREMKEQQVY